RPRNGQFALHSRNHGARLRLYRSAGMGTGRDWPDGFRRNLSGRTSAHGPGVAWRLVGGSDHLALDCGLVNGSKSTGPGRTVVVGSGPQGRLQSVAADDCRGLVNGHAASRSPGERDPADVAVALRHRRSDRRNVFREGGARDGRVFYVAGRRRIVPAGIAGKLADGGRVWRAPHYFWADYRKEIRWLNKARSDEKQNGPRQASRSWGKYTAEHPTVRMTSIA